MAGYGGRGGMVGVVARGTSPVLALRLPLPLRACVKDRLDGEVGALSCLEEASGGNGRDGWKRTIFAFGTFGDEECSWGSSCCCCCCWVPLAFLGSTCLRWDGLVGWFSSPSRACWSFSCSETRRESTMVSRSSHSLMNSARSARC